MPVAPGGRLAVLGPHANATCGLIQVDTGEVCPGGGFGCVASLPPSDANKVLVAGLFRKYAGEGAAELDYKLFTHHLLRESGVRVPLREAMVREEAAKLTDWQYTTAVQQSLGALEEAFLQV